VRLQAGKPVADLVQAGESGEVGAGDGILVLEFGEGAETLRAKVEALVAAIGSGEVAVGEEEENGEDGDDGDDDEGGE